MLTEERFARYRGGWNEQDLVCQLIQYRHAISVNLPKLCLIQFSWRVYTGKMIKSFYFRWLVCYRCCCSLKLWRGIKNSATEWMRPLSCSIRLNVCSWRRSCLYRIRCVDLFLLFLCHIFLKLFRFSIMKGLEWSWVGSRRAEYMASSVRICYSLNRRGKAMDGKLYHPTWSWRPGIGVQIGSPGFMTVSPARKSRGGSDLSDPVACFWK